MDDKRGIRPVSAWRVFWFGVFASFLLDMVGHTWDVFHAGLPVTFTNVYRYGTRAFHAEAWLVSGFILVAYGAFVVGQVVRSILDNREI